MNNNLNNRKKLAIVLLLSIVYVFSVMFIQTSADPVGAGGDDAAATEAQSRR